MSGETSSTGDSVPDIGPWMPTAILHLLGLGVAAGLCLLVLESPIWRAIGLLLAVVGMTFPSVVPGWWLLLVLGLSQLWRAPSVTDAVYYLLLAGVHLLHVLGSLTRMLPWNGRMQLIAFALPLRRFVLVQAVAQPVAAGALFAFGGGPGTVPGLSIFSAAVLGVTAVVLARGLRVAQAHD
jgi:hypothetical protein